MSEMPGAAHPRPKNVIILDANNPMVEVRGEFYWREDHEQIVFDARHQAFQEGFSQGYAAGLGSARTRTILVRPRRRLAGLVARLLLVCFVVAFLLSVVLTVAQVVTHQH